MDRPGMPERSALTVPLERMGGPSRRRAWLTAAAWALGLAGVTWLGLSGHEDGLTVAAAPGVAVSSAPRATVATSAPRDVGPRIVPPIVHYRSLGDDGLVGGLPFGDNVPGAAGPG